MRSYMIQELRPADMDKITAFLHEKGYKCPLDGIFWLPLPVDLWGAEQQKHREECAPFYLALELGPDWIRLELLVRSEQKLRCSCIMYADSSQRETMIDFVDDLIKNLDIAV